MLATLLASLLAIPLLSISPPGSPLSCQREATPEGRVIVLVMVGLDGNEVAAAIAKGGLPHLTALAKKGGLAPLRPALPCDEIGSWVAFNTGQGRSTTGIAGFIRRDQRERGPMPAFGYMEMGERRVGEADVERAGLALEWLPATYPRNGNLLRATPFWDDAARAGVESLILRVGMTFSREAAAGARVLFGEGMTDLADELGRWAVYTDDPDEFRPEGRSTATAGTVYRIDEKDGVFKGRVHGPQNLWERNRREQRILELDRALADPELDWEQAPPLVKELQTSRMELARTPRYVSRELEIRRVGKQAEVRIGDSSQVLSEGQWSEPYRVRFFLNEQLSVVGRTRVKLVSLSDPLRLYVDSVDVDPAQPPFWHPLSSPAGFAPELAAVCGPFDTFGWGASATMSFKDGEVEVDTLLEDLEHTLENAEKLTRACLARDDWRLLVSVFTLPDRLQHMVGQYTDAGHPLYEAAAARQQVAFLGETAPLQAVEQVAYRKLDRVVGEVAAKLGPKDTLIVCSPYGRASSRYQVELNAWLIENGYLQLRDEPEGRRMTYQYADWASTRAYALGLGHIYLNLEGREAQGIVKSSRREQLLEELKAKLLAAKDPRTGKAWCASVEIEEESQAELPDLIVGFAPGYRIAWVTAGGGIAAEKGAGGSLEVGPVISDNRSPWSGGHETNAPESIPGLFACNQAFEVPDNGVHALHVAPSILRLLGVAEPERMERAGLTFTLR